MRKNKTHTWLFAFTDLSFLLLISLSLIPSAPADITLRFSEMDVPVVPDGPNLSAVAPVAELWELRVYAVSEQHPAPYMLLRSPGGSEVFAHLDQNGLLAELERLRGHDIRPVLIPEKSSLTQDFLFATGAMAKVWAGGGPDTAIVRPVTAGETR